MDKDRRNTVKIVSTIISLGIIAALIIGVVSVIKNVNANRNESGNIVNLNETEENVAMKTEDAEENSIDFDIPDTRSAFENSVLSELQIAEFAAGLSERDKKILEMKMKGHRLQEIAEAVGYKTHGAVLKRIRHIADCYEDFISEEYQKYLETF